MTYIKTKPGWARVTRTSGDENTWLMNRGGRTKINVETDTEGKRYVFMGNGKGGLKMVYIPKFPLSTSYPLI